MKFTLPFRALLLMLVLGTLAHWLCGCASAGTTGVVFNPSADPNVKGVAVFYGSNPAITNAQPVSAITGISGVTRTNLSATATGCVVDGLPAGNFYVNAATFSATAISDLTNGVSGYVPAAGTVGVTLKIP